MRCEARDACAMAKEAALAVARKSGLVYGHLHHAPEHAVGDIVWHASATKDARRVCTAEGMGAIFTKIEARQSMMEGVGVAQHY